ncbi:MAG: RNA polymerase subunit sigma-70 [Leptolyngbya sp.]|nr:MAG: RNA polymerase subunit sigma-70 [Leptolyngbya sp.]
MHPRQEIVELFSTFLQFETDYFSHWVIDLRLRRSMRRRLEDYDKRESAFISASLSLEQFWALYWYQCWQTQANTLAEGHLSAYLQEPCYWAAQRIARQFTNVQFGVSDYCQMAIAEIRTVLKGFKPDRGASLKTFANIAFPRLLKDQLRQRQEANLCSSLGLLRRVSKKRLLEALRQASLSPEAIAQYQLAWMCFNALYVQTQTGTNQLPGVDRNLWIAIAHLYNTEQHQQLVSTKTDTNPETIERWLNQCATWVRAYLYPPVESLNVPKAGLDSGGEIQDNLTDSLQESLLTELITQEERQERQEQYFQIHSAIASALKQLDSQSQELLRLYYQQGLTQQQIMQQIQMSQATVSRRLTKAREALLMALIAWSQQTVNSLPTPNQIKDMSAALEEWLRVHYGVPNPDFGRETVDQGTE